jgi:enterochelin esterase family protein
MAKALREFGSAHTLYNRHEAAARPGRAKGVAFAVLFACAALLQPALANAGSPNDTLVSPRVEDGRVVFSVYAPDAAAVQLSGEIFDYGKFVPLTKAANGVWSLAVPAVAPGTYRYSFRIGGADIADPRNTEATRSQTRVQSLLHVPGIAVEDEQPVPHGAVAVVHYRSAAFPTPRRMHVYTPPGYAPDKGPYPVLYLLHGGGDSDENWSTVGRAGFILDNLIAAGKARPMIVVMPAGHVPSADGSIAGAMSAMSEDANKDPFTRDLMETIIPYVESHYAASKRDQDRAIAGLSMGGVQTGNIALAFGDRFPWVGIFSSGWFPEVRLDVERLHGKDMDKLATTERLMWVGYGKTDIARDNSKAMLRMFSAHGIRYQELETDGGHSYANWRLYLARFAPLLFRD